MTNSEHRPEGVHELVESLADPNPVMRREAALRLGLILPKSEEVVSRLGIALNDNDEEVARRAGIALFSYGHEASIAIPSIMQALEHTDICVRRAAAGILFIIGPEAKAAIPMLKRMLNHQDTSLRGWVQQAIHRITQRDAGAGSG